MRLRQGSRVLRRLHLQSLEHRRLLAVAAFQTEIYADEGGTPGELIADGRVATGDTFFLRITAQEFDPARYGLRSAAVDIQWDAGLLDVVEDDFQLDAVITADLPLFRSGSLDNASGTIDELSGTALLSAHSGRSIGNGRAETFALVRMQAGEQPGTGTIQLNSSSTKTIAVPTAVLGPQHLRFGAQQITIEAASADSETALTESANLLTETSQNVTEISQSATEVPQELSESLPETAPATTQEQVGDFDVNGDGLFDLADFGWMNVHAQQAARSRQSVIDSTSTSPAMSDAPNAAPVEAVMRQQTCSAAPPIDRVAVEAWIDALALAWLADTEARKRRAV